MDEAQGAGVEGLAGAEREAVADELLVLGIDGVRADLGAAQTSSLTDTERASPTTSTATSPR